jgi:adenylate cyclase, class 2
MPENKLAFCPIIYKFVVTDRLFPLNKLADYKDYTVKAALRDRSALIAKLESLNAEYVGTDRQTDFYFKTSEGKLKYRKGKIENLITHYVREFIDGTERTTVLRYDQDPTQEEIDLLFRDYEHIAAIEKERTVYLLSNIRIHLDQMNNGEQYVEIEAIDRSNVFSDVELAGQCMDLVNWLGIERTSIIKTGYLDSHQ